MIKRYFSDNNFQRIKKDFSFLIGTIQNSHGEYDFAIRDEYFNIYYKGNSLAKVRPRKDDRYHIEMHTKFFEHTKADAPNLYISKRLSRNNYWTIELSAKQLHPFLKKQHLSQFASRIKAENNGEEITFEQSLITDNLNKQNLIFIDRQTTDRELKRRRMDLLALKQVKGNQYQFLVSEVKLGNNPELKDHVASQLSGYIEHIKKNFFAYKKCFEKYYQQKKQLGLFQKPTFATIEIVEPVIGIIIVGGYSGLARPQIKELKKNHSDLEIEHFTYEL